jgi:triacylglycerol esterase/lipase EstA (alpha/beta hydrolase family)
MTSATNAALHRAFAAGGAARKTVTTPVVLVHGYGGNLSNWLPLELALGREGFANVYVMRYTPLFTDVPGIAGLLLRDCESAMRDAGSDRVHVVAHSLGGVVLRYAVAKLGLGAYLDMGVTVATPHAGTFLARLGRGSVAADLRPRSALLREINVAECPAPVRWVSYWSNCDPIVRPWSAVLPGSVLKGTNVPVPEEGHLSILRSPVFLADVVQRLRLTEQDASVRSDASPAPARLGARTPPEWGAFTA